MNADIDYGLSSSFYKDGNNINTGNTNNGGEALSSTTAVDNNAEAKGVPVFHGSNIRGDVNIRPNTGNSNQNAGSIFFGSLREITTFLRWSTIISTSLTIIWEGFAFPIRLFASVWSDPAQVVLGAYLGFFCFLILGVELTSTFSSSSSSSSVEGEAEAEVGRRRQQPQQAGLLEDNFGFLYDPLLRGCVLTMMSLMSIGILNSWWESLIGLMLGFIGMLYVYTYCKYPEYKRWRSYNAQQPTAIQEAKMYWSERSSSNNNSTDINTNEYSSLLTKVSWADPNSIREVRSLLV